MDQASTGRPRLVVALACVAIFVVILDATIVAVALPDIDRELGLGVTGLPWVVNAYTLAFAGFLLLGGRCCDVFGLRETMLTGFALFGIGSAAAGFADGQVTLLVARACQGLGGALLMPTSLTSITRTIPHGPSRTSALAAWSTVGAVGGTTGTMIGGVLTESLSWRWIFLSILPIVLVAIVLAVRALPSGALAQTRPRLDLPGAALVTAGLTAVAYAVIDSVERGWSDPVIVSAALAGVVLLLVFLGYEHRVARQPLLPPSIFRSRSVSAANLAMFMAGMGLFAGPILISLYVQDVRGYSPMLAGAAFLPSGAAMIIGGRITGRLTTRLGARRAASLGIGLSALGFASLAIGTGTQAPYAIGIAVPSLLYGLGFTVATTPLTLAATRDVAPERQGLASGLLNTTRQTSGATGIAILTTVHASASVPAHGYGWAFAVAAGCTLAASVLAMVLVPGEERWGGPHTRPPHQEQPRVRTRQ